MVVHAEVHLNSTGNLIHPFHTSRAFKLKMHGSVAHANRPHLDRRLRKSRAPFSARGEVFNEGLPWKQVCKDVNALPSLAPDNSFRQRRNFFPPFQCWLLEMEQKNFHPDTIFNPSVVTLWQGGRDDKNWHLNTCRICATDHERGKKTLVLLKDERDAGRLTAVWQQIKTIEHFRDIMRELGLAAGRGQQGDGVYTQGWPEEWSDVKARFCRSESLICWIFLVVLIFHT